MFYFYRATFQAEFPYGLQVKPGVDVRSTFRRSMENVLRWRMNQLRDAMDAATKWPSLKGSFRVHAMSGSDFYMIYIATDRPEASYLLAREGVGPHMIFQGPHFAPRAKLVDWAESRGMQPAWLWAYITNLYHSTEPWLIPHPGIAPDRYLWNTVDRSRDSIDAAMRVAVFRWAERYGAEEISD